MLGGYNKVEVCMKLLLFAGSLRKDSLNKKLLAVAHKILEAKGGLETVLIDLQPLTLPVYDGDIESAGLPENVKMLGQLIDEADALLIASPEYNGSISGALKNTVDWVSRLKPMPLSGKPVLLMGTSPGGLGAVRGLLHSKSPFEKLNNYVYPDVFGIPHGDKAFTATGALEDEATRKRLAALIDKYLDFAGAFTKKKN